MLQFLGIVHNKYMSVDQAQRGPIGTFNRGWCPFLRKIVEKILHIFENVFFYFSQIILTMYVGFTSFHFSIFRWSLVQLLVVKSSVHLLKLLHEKNITQNSNIIDTEQKVVIV